MADAPRTAPSPVRDLTQGPIARTLIVFALPVLGSNVLQSLNGSINALWVGRFLGEEAIAATANANLVLFMILGTVFGMGMAATILVAQHMGRRDVAAAKAVVGTATTFFVGLSAVVSLGGFLLTDQILALLGTAPEVLPLARAYLRILFVAIPAMNFLALLMTVLRGAGDSRTPLRFMMIAVALDVILNPLLILGVGPLPRMGIAGSATATLISQLLSTLVMLFLLYGRKHPLRLVGAEFRLLIPSRAILGTVIGKGSVMGLQMIVISASGLVLMGLVNSYGARTTAAYGVAAQVWAYVQMPALAIGAAVSSMAGQNIGAGRWDRVNAITRAGIGFNLLMTGTATLLLFAAARPILGLFLPLDPAAVDQAVHLNRIGVWSFIPFSITIVLFGMVRATGAVAAPLVVLTISLLGVRLAFALLTQEALGADALWWSFMAGSLTSLTLATGYYLSGRWKKAHMGSLRPPGGEPPDPGYGLPRERAPPDATEA